MQKNEDRTDIPCTHFIEAVEKNIYGWLWECPNGGDKCNYTHALPQGYVLNRDKKDAADKLKELEDEEDEKTIEEIIEEERQKLNNETLTPVNKVSFEAWKKRKAEQKQKELEERMMEAEKTKGKGKSSHILSGKALFKYDPTLFKDDDNAADEKLYEERAELDVIEEGKEEETKEEYEARNNEERKEGEEEEGEENEGIIKKQGEVAVDTNLF